MKKLSLVLALLLALTGCRTVPQFQPDTIVDIPLEPTQAETQPTEPKIEAPTETEPVTEIPTEPATEKPTEQPKKSSSGGSSGKKQNSTTKPTEKPTEAPKQTEPPTEPATEPTTEPSTEPPTEPETEAPTEPVVNSYSPTSLDYAFVEAINAQRIGADLPALSMDSRLCTAAAQRACELPTNWSHTRPDGRDFTTVLHDLGYGYTFAAENLYNTDLPFSADSIVTRWMNADSYRANLLAESASAIGAANYTLDGYTYIAVFIVG